MTWHESDRRERHPEVQLGWEIIGGMVKRRRLALAWTQRDLGWASGLAQSAISRLENGRLKGLRMDRLARLITAMGGLDPGLPSPRRAGMGRWD